LLKQSKNGLVKWLSKKWLFWTLVFYPPLSFLLGLFILLGRYIGGGLEAKLIELEVVNDSVWVLLFAQFTMLILLVISSLADRENLFKLTLYSTSPIKDIFWGVLLGIGIAVSYFYFGLADIHLYLQKQLGDYVPVGLPSEALVKDKVLFFIANVLLAPFVEENIYRRLLPQFFAQGSSCKKLCLSAFLFGCLHWMGGFWYVLITMFFIGLPFGFIQQQKKTLLFVFTAHFVLNLIEFIIGAK